MPSIKDVAREAGVSIATVSRVLNESPLVDDGTRYKVKRAIEKINYKPNLLATGLRSKNSQLIGLLVPDVLHSSFTQIIKQCEENARRRNYGLIIGITMNDPETEAKIIEDFIQRNVNGIIFSRVSDKSMVLKLVRKHKIPIVVIDRALKFEDIPAVVVDNYKAGQSVAAYFLNRGHRHLYCITGPLDISLCRERLNGFADTLVNAGIKFDSTCIFEGDFKYEAGMAAAAPILGRPKKITAVWAQNDLMAIGLLNMLQRKKFRIPEDISVIGMDDSELAQICLPTLTTVRQPFQAMCDKALELLLNPQKKQNERAVLDIELVERETVGMLPPPL